MSTHKHFDGICVLATVLTLLLTFLFMNGEALGISSSAETTGYENRLFDTSVVHKIDVIMDNWDEFIETCENEEYSICAVNIDGENYENVGIRAKGNTSLSQVSQMDSERYSFKLEFDRYENGRSYYGLDKLCLNNLIQDHTMMKDYLVYQMMSDFGVASPLCSFVYITVNGEDWGLYLAVEGIEDGFLQRNYGSDAGALYKPDSMSFGGGRGNGKNFRLEEFDFHRSNIEDGENSDRIPQMPERGEDPPQMPERGENPPQMPEREEDPPQMPEGGAPQMPENGMKGGDTMGKAMGSDDVKLKYIDDDPDSYANIFDNAKTNISESDKKRLIASLKNLSGNTDLEEVLNMEKVLRYFVVHNFVCNDDSYTGTMIHNYYLYEEDGRLEMLPWDYNLAFGTFQGNRASEAVNASIDNPVSESSVDDRPMLGWIFSNQTYTEEYHALFSEFIEQWFLKDTLVQKISDTAALIRPYVEKDPTKFCTIEEFDAGVSALSQFVALRAEAVSRQLNGDFSEIDTGELELSDMGSMNDTKGQHGEFVPDKMKGNTDMKRRD